MEKKFQFFRKLIFLTLLMLGVGSAFGAECAANYEAPANPVWDGTSTQEPCTKDGVYIIDNAAKLAWFAAQVNATTASDPNPNSNINAKLMDDIDLGTHLWTPIAAGKGETKFTGVFDGNHHKIEGLYTDGILLTNTTNTYCAVHDNKPNCNGQNVGFIGTLGAGGVVKDLTLEVVEIQAANSEGSILGNGKPISVGSLVGWQDGGTISGIYVSGSITTSGNGQGVGGIVGNVAKGKIENCVSDVSIYVSGNNAYVGGIAGYTKGDVTISSCAYTGSSIENEGSGGTKAGVVGNSTNNKLKVTNTFYDTDVVEKGLGTGSISSQKPTGVTEINTEENICKMNGGTLTNGECSKESPWSVGNDGISLNGSDGFKIVFDANGGSFADNAKTHKIVAKNVEISAEEISIPLREGKSFGGWAISETAVEPGPLGTADAPKKVYAVWYNFYNVTFKDGQETTIGNIHVAKHGTVSTTNIDVPLSKVIENEDGSTSTYFFVGWSFEEKEPLEANVDATAEDTLHLIDIDVDQNLSLFAVWTKAKIFHVMFNASLHGHDVIHFVKNVTQGQTATRPTEIITEAGYEVEDWCTTQDVECPEENVYKFNKQLMDDLTLYAVWKVVNYSIDYKLDGGINATGNPTTYNINSDDIVFVNPTKTGASFDGWFYNYENGDFFNRATQITKGSSGNKTLYAKWIPNKYTIQYVSGNRVAGTTLSDVKEHDKSIQLKNAVDVFAIPGCSQDGWSKAELGNLDYALGAEYVDNENLKLYPHWTCNTYGVEYELFDVPGVINHKDNPTQYTGPKVFTLRNAYDPSDSKRLLMEWCLESPCQTVVKELKNIDNSITLYARWYNLITFQPGTKLKNAGTGAVKVEQRKYLDQLFVLSLPNDKYTLANYTLDGWSTTDGGDKVYDVGEEYTANENLTLYPHWVENSVSTKYGAVTIYTYATDGRKEAVIDGTSEETVNIPAADNVSVNQVVFNRDFSGGVRSTVMFPFTVSLDDVSGGEFWEFTAMEYDSETKKWTFRVNEPVDNELKANKPYIFIAEDKNITFTLSGAVSLSTENMNPSVHDGWVFKGSYEQITFNNTHPDWTYGYGYSDDDKKKVTKGKFVRFKTSGFDKVNLTPMRAYLVYQPSLNKSANIDNEVGELPEFVDVEIVGKKGFVIGGGMFNTKTGEIKMDRWYDLSGRKLNGKPTAQGTYYYNGKRVIIR